MTNFEANLGYFILFCACMFIVFGVFMLAVEAAWMRPGVRKWVKRNIR